jgi:predicted CDP-diglyceride synthetase/phosphatidate cytidylyltransferase
MMSEPQGLVHPEGLGILKKFVHLIGFQTRDERVYIYAYITFPVVSYMVYIEVLELSQGL